MHKSVHWICGHKLWACLSICFQTLSNMCSIEQWGNTLAGDAIEMGWSTGNIVTPRSLISTRTELEKRPKTPPFPFVFNRKQFERVASRHMSMSSLYYAQPRAFRLYSRPAIELHPTQCGQCGWTRCMDRPTAHMDSRASRKLAAAQWDT